MGRRENTFKKHLISKIGTRWDVQSHEDKFSSGIPDLSFGAEGVNGWIELKQIERLSATLKPKKYTPTQVSWIRRRGKKGGHCFVFVKVVDDYYLFDWQEARRIRHGMSQSEYLSYCVRHWTSIEPDEFIEAITAHQVDLT